MWRRPGVAYGRRSTWKARVIMAGVVLAIGAFGYCSKRSLNPVTGEVQYVALSPEQEVALGLDAAPALADQFGGEVTNPPELHRYVLAVGNKVAGSVGGKTPWVFDFHVLRDPNTVNAFALPGGQIFITQALLEQLTSEAQLAAVLGHEVGHVIERHGSEHMAKQELSQYFVTAVGVAGSDDYRSGQYSAMLASWVASMVNMKYGRDDELESDRLGVKYMTAAGYEGSEMIKLMEVLQRAGGGRGQSEFFSSHPNPENRTGKIEALLKETGRSGGEVGTEEYRKNVLEPLSRI